MNRRKFFGSLFGAVAVAMTPEVLIPKAPQPGIIYADYIPIIRNTLPNLIAQDLIAFQPMSAPTGQIFHVERVHITPKPRRLSKDWAAELIDTNVQDTPLSRALYSGIPDERI